MKKTLLILASFLAATGARAAGNAWSLGLGSVEDAAVRESKQLQALKQESDAAGHKADSARESLYPKIAADGSYKWLANVPEVKLNPAAPAIKLGDNNNWSVGLSATWDLVSPYQLKQWKSAQALQAAKNAEFDHQSAALRLLARLDYFQTQLAAERVRLLANSLLLAQSQADDQALRVKAGSSSRIDALAAASDELTRRSQLRAARTDLAAALRDVYALTGMGAGSDPSLPSVDMGDTLPANIERATLIVKLDAFEDTEKTLAKAADVNFDPTQSSRLRQLFALRDAALAQAEAAFTGHYPHFGASVRGSQDYPDGFVPESTSQFAAGINVSVPLYSFGATSDLVAEGDALATASDLRAQSQAVDLARDFLKSKDRVASLYAQKALQEEQVKQTAALADLVIAAKKIGGASYLEVQSAELNALAAGTSLATTETQLLIELATLDALSR